jgi:hypothetical protein
MNSVGELLRVRNQILQFTSTYKDAAFTATSQRLYLITTELQENVMKTRMQSISTLWSKLPRVVRDLANACGKQVRLEMEGKDTKLDKTLIEAIKIRLRTWCEIPSIMASKLPACESQPESRLKVCCFSKPTGRRAGHHGSFRRWRRS